MNVTFPGISMVSLSRVIEDWPDFQELKPEAIQPFLELGFSHGLQVKPNNIGMFDLFTCASATGHARGKL